MELATQLDDIGRLISDIAALEADTATEADIIDLLNTLSNAQQMELLALALIGRGNYAANEWDEALAAAADREAEPAVAQLSDFPMLAACLEAGLAAFDLRYDAAGQID
jgi:hypothetical protein